MGIHTHQEAIGPLNKMVAVRAPAGDSVAGGMRAQAALAFTFVPIRLNNYEPHSFRALLVPSV